MKIHLLLGRTGVGKTARATSLARVWGVPVVVLDRFQVFAELATGTGRPTALETQGTHRVYLDSRSLAQGELTPDESLKCLERVLNSQRCAVQTLILEGGSLSLCTLLADSGLLDNHDVEVEHLDPSDTPTYRERVLSRVRGMVLCEGVSILDELQAVWADPPCRAFVATIAGYDAAIACCMRWNRTPRELLGADSIDEVVESITAAHLAYADRQALFLRAVAGRWSAFPKSPQSPKPTQSAESAKPPESTRCEHRGALAQDETFGFDPLAPGQHDDPYPVYARLRGGAAVVYSATLDMWIASRHEDVALILRNHADFSSASSLKAKLRLPDEVAAVLATGLPSARTLNDNDPPSHNRFRALVSRAFTPQRVAALEPKIAALTAQLIDSFVDDGEVDFMRKFAFPLPGRVIADMLGVPAEDLPDFKRWCDDWMALQSATLPTPRLVECAHGYLRLQRYFSAQIEARRRAPSADLLSALVEADREDSTPFTPVELVRTAMSLLVAGHETTTHFLGNALLLLLKMPSAMEELRRDEHAAPRIVEEALRMDTPVQSLFRSAVRDVEIGGVRVPEGARIIMLFGSANHDERQFHNPACFDTRRSEPSKHLSFGRGVHHCIGAPLARLEGKLALKQLVDRLPNLRLADGGLGPRVAHFFLRGYERMVIQWDRPTS
jgi:cytochrome P450